MTAIGLSPRSVDVATSGLVRGALEPDLEDPVDSADPPHTPNVADAIAAPEPTPEVSAIPAGCSRSRFARASFGSSCKS